MYKIFFSKKTKKNPRLAEKFLSHCPISKTHNLISRKKKVGAAQYGKRTNSLLLKKISSNLRLLFEGYLVQQNFAIYLHLFNKFRDSSTGLQMLLEQLGWSEMTAPDSVYGHGGLEFIHKLPEHMFVGVGFVNCVCHLF